MKVILRGPDEGYSRDVSYALYLISTFSLEKMILKCEKLTSLHDDDDYNVNNEGLKVMTLPLIDLYLGELISWYRCKVKQ